MKKILTTCVLFIFLMSSVATSQSLPLQGSVNLPEAGAKLSLTSAFMPVTIKGMTVYPDNPFQFDFIVDPGDGDNDVETGFKTVSTDEVIAKESEKIIKYFLASLTIPEENLWVNLSPYEKNRIANEEFGQTEMGRDMLAQDYLLKQLTASLTDPNDELGKRFWDKLYKQAFEEYGATDIPMDALNKVWIVPDKAVVFEKGQSVFVVESRLKVMMAQDYEAMANQKAISESRAPARDVAMDVGVGLRAYPILSGHPQGDAPTKIFQDIILPSIEKEVNQGKTFATLRQMYHAMILASWYKDNLKRSLLNQVYADKNMVEGVDIDDKDEKQRIYNKYLEAFKKGAYNYIKEDFDHVSKQVIPRKYFSGGVDGAMLSSLREDKKDVAALSGVQVSSLPGGDEQVVTFEARHIPYKDPAMFVNKKRIDKRINGIVERSFSKNGVLTKVGKNPQVLSKNKVAIVKILNRFVQMISKQYENDDSEAEQIVFLDGFDKDSVASADFDEKLLPIYEKFLRTPEELRKMLELIANISLKYVPLFDESQTQFKESLGIDFRFTKLLISLDPSRETVPMVNSLEEGSLEGMTLRLNLAYFFNLEGKDPHGIELVNRQVAFFVVAEYMQQNGNPLFGDNRQPLGVIEKDPEFAEVAVNNVVARISMAQLVKIIESALTDLEQISKKREEQDNSSPLTSLEKRLAHVMILIDKIEGSNLRERGWLFFTKRKLAARAKELMDWIEFDYYPLIWMQNAANSYASFYGSVAWNQKYRTGPGRALTDRMSGFFDGVPVAGPVKKKLPVVSLTRKPAEKWPDGAMLADSNSAQVDKAMTVDVLDESLSFAQIVWDPKIEEVIKSWKQTDDENINLMSFPGGDSDSREKNPWYSPVTAMRDKGFAFKWMNQEFFELDDLASQVDILVEAFISGKSTFIKKSMNEKKFGKYFAHILRYVFHANLGNQTWSGLEKYFKELINDDVRFKPGVENAVNAHFSEYNKSWRSKTLAEKLKASFGTRKAPLSELRKTLKKRNQGDLDLVRMLFGAAIAINKLNRPEMKAALKNGLLAREGTKRMTPMLESATSEEFAAVMKQEVYLWYSLWALMPRLSEDTTGKPKDYRQERIHLTGEEKKNLLAMLKEKPSELEEKIDAELGVGAGGGTIRNDNKIYMIFEFTNTHSAKVGLLMDGSDAMLVIDASGLQKKKRKGFHDAVKKALDVAMVVKHGGIDFNSDKLDLQLTGHNDQALFSASEQTFQNIKIRGLYPVILNIRPITDSGIIDF